MLRSSIFWALTILLAAPAFSGALLSGGTAKAQTEAIAQRLVTYGRMPARAANSLASEVDRKMKANAARGGNQYDPIRQAVNRAIFGNSAGPGSNPAEYDQRLAQVIARLGDGLTEAAMQRLFAPGSGAALSCARTFEVNMAACDALIAAASQQPAPFPYLAPVGSADLARELRGAGLRRAAATSTARALGDAMARVAVAVRARDSRGSRLRTLLSACPGASNDEAEQVRAWNLGPSVNMARCIAGALGRDGVQRGAANARELFGMTEAGATAFVRWGAPNAPSAPAAVATRPPPGAQQVAQAARRPANDGWQRAETAQGASATAPVAPQVAQAAPPQQAAAPAQGNQATAGLMQVGRGHYEAQRYPQAAAAFEAAAQLEPTNALAFASLANCQYAQGDFRNAEQNYRHAIRIEPRNTGFRVAQARALLALGDRDAAIVSLQGVLIMDPENVDARNGLTQLGAPPPPVLPESPSRDQVINAMRSLQAAVEGCAPNYEGVVRVRLLVLGATGEVMESEVMDALAGTDEGECVAGVAQSASFPRFQRNELTVNYPFQLGQ